MKKAKLYLQREYIHLSKTGAAYSKIISMSDDLFWKLSNKKPPKEGNLYKLKITYWDTGFSLSQGQVLILLSCKAPEYVFYANDRQFVLNFNKPIDFFLWFEEVVC
jgi:hypothetical protein